MAQGHGAALARALGGEAQDGDLGVDAEDLGGLGGLHRDLSQLGGGGQLDLAGGFVHGVLVVDVDGAVAHGDPLQTLFAPVAVQDEAGADQVGALLGLDQLEGGADGVRSGVGGAAQQAVGLAHFDQHGAKVIGLLQQVAALLGGHLALAQLDHGVDHLVKALVGIGVDNLSAGNIKAACRSRRLALGLVADHDDLQDLAGQQLAGGFQNAGIAALGENDGLGVRLQLLYQRRKHICHFDYLRCRSSMVAHRVGHNTLFPLYFNTRR